MLDIEELASVRLDILLEVRVADAVQFPSKGIALAVNVGVGHGLAVWSFGPRVQDTEWPFCLPLY